jgi:hypothetical protein
MDVEAAGTQELLPSWWSRRIWPTHVVDIISPLVSSHGSSCSFCSQKVIRLLLNLQQHKLPTSHTESQPEWRRRLSSERWAAVNETPVGGGLQVTTQSQEPAKRMDSTRIRSGRQAAGLPRYASGCTSLRSRTNSSWGGTSCNLTTRWWIWSIAPCD